MFIIIILVLHTSSLCPGICFVRSDVLTGVKISVLREDSEPL